MSRATLLLLGALLLLPAAAAVGTHETRGRLDAPDGVAARGQAHLRGEGILELGGDADLRVAFARLVSGTLEDRTRDRVHLGLHPEVNEASASAPRSRPTSLPPAGEGRIENVRCGARCLVAVYALPGEGLVGASGFLDHAFAPAADARNVSTSTPGQGPESQFRYELPAGTLDVTDDAFRDARPTASGRIGLVLRDATFDLVTEDGARTVDARWSTETTRAVAGQPVMVRHHARHVVLVLDAAALDVAPGAPFRLGYPAGLHATLDGALAAGGATGTVTVGGTRHAVEREDVLLDGAFGVTLGGDAPGLLDGAGAVSAAVEGRATRVVIAGVDVAPALPAEAAAAGGGVLAALAATLLGRWVVLPLFHRLGPSDVLRNGNRRLVYETIRARPGISVVELVAAVGLTRILVRHHLRMLEAHRLVRATVWRRRRTYALAGEGEGQAACELKDPTRRRVAAALVRAGRATQKDLALGLGLSQRLVSYHLARLDAASLVRTEGRNPRAYHATDALVRAVAREEGDAAAARGATAA